MFVDNERVAYGVPLCDALDFMNGNRRTASDVDNGVACREWGTPGECER